MATKVHKYLYIVRLSNDLTYLMRILGYRQAYQARTLSDENNDHG